MEVTSNGLYIDYVGESECNNPISLQWRHNKRDSVSNHQRLHCLLNYRFRRRSKKTSKLHVTGLCAGISPVAGEFPAQKASNAENISIRWRYHATVISDIDENWLESGRVSKVHHTLFKSRECVYL